jgi:glycosyltransferase involved in cell wall biosynthesis
MAETPDSRSPLRACTISTRSGAERARELEASVAGPLDIFVLDGDGDGAGGGDGGGSDIESLAGLLGESAERFAAGFDQAELTLLLLPRLLARMLDGGARSALYVDARAQPRGEAIVAAGDAVRIDPWPSAAPLETECVGAILVPATPAVATLLSRWAELATRVLDEDRPLTPRTTLRWLSALAGSIEGVEITSAGLLVERPAGRPEPEAARAAERSPDLDYGFASLPGGISLTTPLRRLLRRSPFTRPFSALDTRELVAWLAAPADPPRAVPRYLAALSDLRPDLRDAFGSPRGENDAALLAWAQTDGREQDPVLALIFPAPSGAPADAARPADDHRVSGLGVNAVGYWQAELGIADAARLLVAGLDAARVPVQPVSVPGAAPPSRHDEAFAAVSPDNPGFAINLLSLNPDGLLAFAEQTGPEFFAGRANIGYWWWEVLDAFPAAWRPAFDLVQEVWVGSNYVRDAIAPASSVPVRLVPIPVRPLSARRSRAELGLPDGFLFLTMFDYNSAFERKNPLGAVRAFQTAFAPGSGASLVVKSINGAKSPDNRDELTIIADGHPDIHLRDGYLSGADVDALLACADCVVSLHRAEGFGIPLARALRSEIPVVATGYGGNLDFMSDENSFLVSHRPATVPEGTIYPPGARWADPDLEHAAAQLRQVFDHPQAARARARRAAASLADRYSPASTGARMALELQRVHLDPTPTAERARAGPALLPAAMQDLRALLHSPLAELGGTSRGAHAARRSLERLTLPIVDRQRAIDERLLDAMLRLGEANERHAYLLGQISDTLSTAPASATAELAREIRRDRESLQAALAELREQARRKPGEAVGTTRDEP